MKPKAEPHLSLLFFFISLLSLVPSSVFCAGLAAMKDQTFHDDAGANIVVYSALKESAMSVQIQTASRTFTIERQKLAGKIEVISALPKSITTETELEPVRKTAKEYRDFSARFPKSASILTPHIAALDACITEFEGGKARYNGEWMPREEALAAKLKMEQTPSEAETVFKQKREEKLAFEKSQHEKGLVEYGGKWVTEDEARRLEAQAQAIVRQQADAENKRRKAEEEYESDGLVLLLKTVNSETDEWGTNITGTVVNRTGRELELTMIEYKLYDASEAQIGNASASITELEAGGRWNFKAHSFKKARGYKLSKLSKY